MKSSYRSWVMLALVGLAAVACGSSSSGSKGTSDEDAGNGGSANGNGGSASGNGGSASSNGGASASGGSSSATSSGACMGAAGLFCYQWTNIPASAAACDSSAAPITACPTTNKGVCTVNQGGGSLEIISISVDCADAKKSCNAGAGTFTGGGC